MKIGTDFSGIGSPEMALKLLGIEHKQVFACEIDKYARKSHRAIYGEDYKLYEDITKRDHSEVEQLDLYVAGFPCQAFSMAGKRKGFEDTRGTLFFNVAEFIKINQPKCFILENVKGLLSHDGGKTFQTIISLLTDNGGTANGQMFIPYFEDGLGYHVYYKVLNTKDFGIPQNRERIFIVGFKEFREFRFPKPFPLELRLKDMLQDNPDYKKLPKLIIDDKFYLSDKNLSGLMKGQSKPQFTDGNDICRCFTAGGNSGGMHSSMTLIIDEKYYLSDKMLDCLINHKSDKFTVTTPLINDTETARTLRTEMAKMGRQDNYIQVPSATKKGYEEAEDGDSISLDHPSSKSRRGRVGKGVAQTVNTVNGQAVVKQVNPSKESNGQQPYQQNRVYDTDGLSPALNANLSTGGNMIIAAMRGRYDKNKNIQQELEINETGTTNSITTVQKDNLLIKDFKIRRLTPLECWRLQGFPDAAFIKAQKVNSDTQLYKQAGNSITVNVMMELFKKIYETI